MAFTKHTGKLQHSRRRATPSFIMSHSTIIETQRRYFETGATLPVAFRIAQLKRLHAAIKRHEHALCQAVFEDFGKSSFDVYSTELMLMLSELEDAIRLVPKWAKKRRVRTNLLTMPAKSYVVPEPLGVALIIGAWNYPYLLSLSPMVSALAAGNTVVLKPSELPQATSRALAELIGETFDPAYCTVVEGGVNETKDLLTHRFDKIFFTGSTAVGKLVYRAAAVHLTPVTLELGGKSPAFVTRDCELKLAARRIVWGKFLNAGQTCIAPDYVLVDSSVEQPFLEACRDEIVRSRYAVENGNYTQIINERHFQRLLALLPEGKCYHGGRADAATRTLEPTLLQGVTFDDAVMQEEIFGPILPVIAYTRLDDAIAAVKRLPHPLSCYVFARDPDVQAQVVSRVPFGGGTINDTVLHIANPHLPFGGVGPSGIGRYHSEAGFLAFSNEKAILHKFNWFDLPLRYSPLTPNKLKWLRRLMRLSSLLP